MNSTSFPQTPCAHVSNDEIVEDLANGCDTWSIAEHMVDSDVSKGEYEGCSSELEMAFGTYESHVKRVLAALGG
jgi:hypothetical protein